MDSATKNNVTPTTAIAAVWATLGHILFPAKTSASIAALAGFGMCLHTINKRANFQFYSAATGRMLTTLPSF